ncbi:hypothetical protein [Streptomyces sp. NPDC058294]|uniref:helix-turn-helix domain-containing protein n=1 Tax=Streptomyces sp. NPDC058294 TaxID=3346430 RepID=UPI0036E22303
MPQSTGGTDELTLAWNDLHEKIKETLEKTGLGRTQFAQRYGFNPSSVTRWASEGQRRLPSRSFMVKLLTAVENARGGPLPEHERQAVFAAWWRVIELGHYPHLRDVGVALREEVEARGERIDAQEDQLRGQAAQIRALFREIRERTEQSQHLTAMLSHAYDTIRRLEFHIAQLRQAGLQQEAAMREAELSRARLQVSHLRAQREVVWSQTALLEDQLPPVVRGFYPVEQELPEREDVPLWWPEAAQAIFPPLPPPPLPGRRRGISTYFLAAALALALAALGLVAWRSFPPTSSKRSAQPSNPPHPTASASSPAPASASSPAPAAVDSPATSPGPSKPVSSAPATDATDSGWSVQYRRTRITVPATTLCVGASVDFEVPRGYEGTSDDVGSGHDDLTIRTGCGDWFPASVEFFDQPRGQSSPQEPSPEQCLTDANRNAVPSAISVKDFKAGTAFCMVTPQGTLVWFKVLAAGGNSGQESRILQATSWRQ